MNLLCYLLPMAILQLGLPAAATSSVCEQPNPSACQAEINHVTVRISEANPFPIVAHNVLTKQTKGFSLPSKLSLSRGRSSS
ncbi:hypothetical protein BZA77DRAFT_153321 [Pyronema omphalodes]|nr:hypothetical protein BZA77DRAFT_153321 [Pyronema omphalodes]